MRKSSVPILPIEFKWRTTLVFDEVGALGFDQMNHVRNGIFWVKSPQNMGMIRHQVDGQHFVVFVLLHPSNVPLYFFPEMGLDQAGTVFYSKNQVNVELGIGIGFHGVWF